VIKQITQFSKLVKIKITRGQQPTAHGPDLARKAKLFSPQPL